MSTEKLLEERKNSHGEYSEHAQVTQDIMDALMRGRNWKILPPMIRESLHMFAHKMGRIVTGDPCHKDHYDDIAGYAVLISQRISLIIGQVQALRDKMAGVLRRGEPVSRPGTPEDGGHHARQKED